MPQLDVTWPDGRREQLSLGRATPLTIGSQTFNDVCIPDDGVAAMHCRIGWNKTGYEVTAATSRGVELNTVLVQHAFLKPGDLLRVGRCDLAYADDVPAARPAREAARADKKRRRDEAPVRKEDRRKQPVKTAAPVPEVIEEPDELQYFPDDANAPPQPEPAGAESAQLSPIARELRGGRRRPGEQEILKSPFILTFGVGSIVLLLIAATLWLLLGRETSANLFQRAEQDLAQAKYAQAIGLFEEYQQRYPASERTPAARINAAKARVQKEMTGASPAWSLAEERLQQLVREFRNTDHYTTLKPVIRGYAAEIAQGAAETAGTSKDDSLLAVSQSARQILERTSSEDDSLTAALERIQVAYDKSEAAIARQKLRDAAVARMQSALQAGNAMTALAERESLLRQLPEFGRDREIAEILQQSLSRELQSITVTEGGRQAATDEIPAPALLSVLPVFHARSRTGDVSVGQNVRVLAQDSCYAVDTVTGDVVWRRVIGREAAFPPVETRGDVTGWLMYDRRRSHLVHCRADKGQLIWRQPLSAPPQGPPLIDEGQIFLITAARELLRIDLETGEITATLAFTQPVFGPPVLNVSGEVLFFVGERGLIYAVRKRPLEPLAVTFTDHAAGAVQAPLTTVGRLLLLAENDRANSSRLRLWDTTDPTQPLRRELEQRADGQVRDAPVLRGPHLVVPMQGERLAAYVLNDAAGRAEMTLVGNYRVQDGYRGPMSVVLGPDNQFWMSSTAFRRFEIAADSIRMESTSVAVGLTSQPLQLVGETFFVARRARFAEGVQFSNVDRQSLSGTWRTVVGARPVAVSAAANGDVVAVTESGFVVHLNSGRLGRGGIEQASMVDLEWPADLVQTPLARRLADGRLAISISGATPRLWLIETSGRVNTPVALPAALEQPPVLLGQTLILPLPGKLQPRQAGRSFADWQAPLQAGPPPQWAHLLPTAEDELLTFDRAGTCRRLQLRTGEIPHLAEIAAITLPEPAGIAPVPTGESVIVAVAGGRLLQLHQRTLDIMADIRLPAPVAGMVVSGAHLLVWDQETLRRLDPQKDLAEVWSTPLQGMRPVGQAILHDRQLWLACEGGEILRIAPDTGTLATATTCAQRLSYGLIKVNDQLLAVACDGTVYQIPASRESEP